MRRFILLVILCLASSIAQAQNQTCPNRPSSDNSNACANTRFVKSAPIAATQLPAFTGGDCTTSAGSVALSCAGIPKAITAWGDSITLRWPVELSSDLSRPILGNGVSGDTSAQIKARFDASPQLHKNTTIFWVGRNDFSNGISNSTILANIASMVAALGHDRYLILGILNADTANEYSGAPGYATITSLNSSLASTYGSHYFDMRAYLVSQYNASIPQDVTDHGHDVPPSSLRVDVLHPNDAGATVIAAKLATLIAPIEAASTSKTAFDSAAIDGAQQVVNYNGQLAVGLGSLANNTTGQGNEAFGDYALWSNTTGSYNQAFGFHAMYFNTTAVSNAAFGYQAMTANTTGSYNASFGTNSLVSNTTGNNGVAIGSNALYSNTSGAQNVAIGYAALFSNTTGNNNTAFGNATLFHNTANGNVAFGATAGYSNTTGAGVTAVGNSALYSNTTGTGVTAVGLNAAYSNTTANDVTAVGSGALFSNTTASDVTAVGFNALYQNTTGANNSAFGSSALFANTTGTFNSAFGNGAMSSTTTGGYNTAVGGNVLNANTVGYSNVGVGYNVLVANVDGYSNAAFGQSALAGNTSGAYLTGLGLNALVSNTTGNFNVGVGSFALSGNVAGSNNVAIGYNAGNGISGGAANNNTIIGHATGLGITTGANNTVVGANVSGLSSSLAGAVILAAGDGSIRADYGKTMPGGWTHAGGIAFTAPSTKTTDYTVADSDYSLIMNCAASCTLTLPTPANYNGRILKIRTIAAFTTVSASSNVVPLVGGAAGTAILAATAGKWAELQSDGTNWLISQAN